MKLFIVRCQFLFYFVLTACFRARLSTGLAGHAVIPLQSNILEVIQGRAVMGTQSMIHQASAMVFFVCSMKHAWATIQLYVSSKSLPMRWAVSKTSIVLKCLALALAFTGLPLATYFHPAGVDASETNTGGTSQWCMVAALIAYYMTFTADIYLLLQASKVAPDRAQVPAHGHRHAE